MSHLPQAAAMPAGGTGKGYVCPPSVLFGMCIAVSIYWLFALSMNPLVPSIARDLHLPLGVADPNLALAVSLAGLTAGICIMPMGGLADQFGRIRLTRIGLGVGLVGALLCGLAPSIGPLVAGRFFLGLSAAIVMPATLGLVKVYYGDAERPRAITYWSLATAGCASFSSLFGGILATHAGWRWAFLLAVPCILGAFFLLRSAPERKAPATGRRPFDGVGFSALILGLLALNLFISKGKAWGWTSLPTLGSLGLFALMLAIFIPNERRQAAPIADLSLFRSRAFTGAVVANLFVNSLLGVLVVIMIYLQKGRGLSAMQASLLTLGYALAVLALLRVGEKVARITGPRLPMMLGGLSLIGLVVPLACTFVQSNVLYFTWVFIGLAFLGVGLGLFMTPATTLAINEAPADKAALAGGIFKMGSSLGGAFGIAIHLAIFGAVLQSTGSLHAAARTSIAFGLVAAVLACLVPSFLTPTHAA
ncbi:multidrug efflux MFS transporter NorB [Mesoterricola sediminis]|uniref:Multidrug efflux MFS transporter NorB n=2 Tax=Mesoterricola sediminis TaxID=2927980 RepID=A0AA48GR14_9BACT|nr:multidrug efflux MFS transporter NorB [Mesoterricola sediminis]